MYACVCVCVSVCVCLCVVSPRDYKITSGGISRLNNQSKQVLLLFQSLYMHTAINMTDGRGLSSGKRHNLLLKKSKVHNAVF